MRTILALILGVSALPALAVASEPPPAGAAALWATPRHRQVAVRAAPRRGAPSLGSVRGGAEVRVEELDRAKPRARRGACSAWLAVAPAGYVCQDEVRLRRGPPAAADDGTGHPGYRYALVRSATAPLYLRPGVADEAVLRRGDGVTVTGGDGRWLRTTLHRYVRRDDVEFAGAPALSGRDLRGLPLDQRFRVGWLVPAPGEDDVPIELQPRVALGPGGGAGLDLSGTQRAPRYQEVYVEGEAGGGRTAVRLGGPEGASGRVEARYLRRVLPAPPPADLAPGERWLDIALSQQVAVAYAGREPVFATLVSTAPGHGTPEGTFYIYRKYRTQRMANLEGASSRYDFRQVPWAQFFNGRIGLHAVLWRDLLGHPASHGCVNLSPPDAARLFAFTDPPLPPGWNSIRGGFAEAPPPSPGGAGRASPAARAGGTRVVVRR